MSFLLLFLPCAPFSNSQTPPRTIASNNHHLSKSLPVRSMRVSYLGHRRLSLEASPHAVVDTLGLPPAGVDTLEAVTLVALEARSACSITELDSVAPGVATWWMSVTAEYARATATGMAANPTHPQMCTRSGIDVRFLTMGTCCLAATIWNDVSALVQISPRP